MIRILLIIVITTLSPRLLSSNEKNTNDLNEVRLGVGLPFTFIASTPGVILINTNIEYSRSINAVIPLLKIQYSSYQRMSRKKGILIATEFDLALNALELHTGLKYSIPFLNFELRPLFTLGRGFGKYIHYNKRLKKAQSYTVYTVGLELFSRYKNNYFLSFVGTLSKIDYPTQDYKIDITFNRPSLELNVGRSF